MTEDGIDTPAACPHCGYDGAVDGHGTHRREFERMSAADGHELVTQTWDEMHCPECNGLFALAHETTAKVIDP